MKPITNETELQEAVNEDIRKIGWPFFHRKSGRGGKYVTANTFTINGLKMKWPDLIIYPGKTRAVFIELKDKYKKPSVEQQNFLDYAKGMGYPVYVVKSWEQWELVRKIELQIQGRTYDVQRNYGADTKP